VVSGAPAIAADGGAVLLAIQSPDGARGNPNLRLALIDRAGRTLAGLTVLEAAAADDAIDAEGPTPALRAQIAAANAWLAEQHAARRLVPLTPLDVEPAEAIASTWRASRGALVVTWRASQLTVASGAAPVHDRATPPTWLVADRPHPAGDGSRCRHPAFLAGAAIDLSRRVAVITIGYGGTDLCWEPDPVTHVIAW
jgi:hypothetical protein